MSNAVQMYASLWRHGGRRMRGPREDRTGTVRRRERNYTYGRVCPAPGLDWVASHSSLYEYCECGCVAVQGVAQAGYQASELFDWLLRVPRPTKARVGVHIFQALSLSLLQILEGGHPPRFSLSSPAEILQSTLSRATTLYFNVTAAAPLTSAFLSLSFLSETSIFF